jgi:TRAP-type transport system small permease protein
MKTLEALLSFLSGCCLLVLLAVVFADVMMRNLFNSPLIWATDLTELGMGVMAFAAMPLLALRLRHIGIDLLPLAEKSFAMHLVNFVVSIFTGGVFLVLAWQFRVFALRTARTGEFLPQLGLHWTYVWWTLCVLAAVTVAASLVPALQQLRLMARSIGARS